MLSPSALAQLISSGLTGKVVNADGTGVAGATVTAVHTPTNATFTAVTAGSGRFNFRGLPVGGPYTLSAKAEGLVSESITGIATELGNDVEVNIVVKSEILELEKVVISGAANALDASAIGSGMVLNSERLAAKPTSERSFADLISATPQVSLQALSSANDREEAHIVAVGQNNRYNSIMIDGARTNDVFGLNGTGIAAFFNPLSVDTIEQLSVQVSPYEVTMGGFTGATINAVTKSGTNEFHGSAYYYFRGDHLAGFQLQGENVQDAVLRNTKVVPKLERTTWGATLGGPIWKDHIFFFLNYENYESISNGRQLTFAPAAGVEDQILARLKQYSSAIPWGDKVTGATSNRQTDEKILAKVDWQINAQHRLSARYSKTDGRVPQFGNLGGGVTINGVTSGQVGTSPTGHFYDQTRVGESYSGQLFSQWTPDFKTEIKYTHTTDDQLTPTYSTAPLIVINGVSGTDLRNGSAITNGTYVAGTEQFRHGNVINVVNQQVTAKGDYFWKDFVFTAGIEYETSDFLNLFRSGSYGLVAFRTLNDFLNDTNGVISRNYYDPNARPVADISDFTQTDIYAQAKWDVTPRFDVLFGLRADVTSSDLRPALNQNFLTKTGFRNDGSPGGVTTVSPRIGVNYALDDERKTQIRGGLGHFLGRSPWVFFSNSFGNTGVGTFSRASTDSANPLSGSLANYLSTQFDPNDPIGFGADNPTLRREVDFNDDGVKLPSVWRGNIAVDRKVPFLDSTVTVEFVYSKVDEELRTTNENLKPTTVGADGRQRFAGNPTNQANALYPEYTNMYRVSNVSEGESKYLTILWERPLKNKWAFNLAYTRGRATAAQSNSQTTAGGQWFRNVVFNQNTVEVGTADYEIKDRVQLGLTRQFEFIKKFKTTTSLYYEGRSGNPVSWVFGGDLNNDGTSFNDAAVIPTGLDDPRFDFSGMTTAQQTAFFDFIKKSGLSKYAGAAWVPKNSFREPWTNRLDINLKQDIPIHGSAKLQLFFDFINFGYFLSKSTFGYTEVAPNQSNDAYRMLTLTSGSGYNAAGQIRPLFTGSGPNSTYVPPPYNIDNQQSRWRVQVGAKLLF
jgi:hypothetical protein